MNRWGWVEFLVSLGLLLVCMFAAPVLGLLVGWAILGHGPSQRQIVIPVQIVSYLLWLLAIWVQFRWNRLSLWTEMAWRWPASGNVLFYAAAGPLMAVGVGLMAGLLRAKEPEMGLMKELLSDPVTRAQLVIFGVSIGPLAEEILFRGLALPVFSRFAGDAGGLLLTSVPFALMHGPQYNWSWQHLVLLTAVGVIFGSIRLRSRSTLASTVTHAAYNLTMFAGYFLRPV